MSARLHAVCWDAHDPTALRRFWDGLLGGFEELAIRFEQTDVPKVGLNQMHLDLTCNLEPQDEVVARALSLGATHLDVGQLPGEGHVVLADPEGNEFCVVEPGNSFLADCGFVGALSSDGSQALGHFWSRALGWPLIWDQDEETAIRSTDGGPIISWGGPPLTPKTSRRRLRLEVVGELDELLALGATDLGNGELLDPDGNEVLLR